MVGGLVWFFVLRGKEEEEVMGMTEFGGATKTKTMAGTTVGATQAKTGMTMTVGGTQAKTGMTSMAGATSTKGGATSKAGGARGERHLKPEEQPRRRSEEN